MATGRSDAEVRIRGRDDTRQAFDQVNRRFDEMGRRVERQARQFQGLGRVIAASFAGLSVAAVMRAVVRESTAAQEEQKQLAAVLRSTGEAAGFTREQLNAMASELAGRSVFSEGEINRAQTRLLSYTGIVGETFPQAMQQVIDMSARMGMSLEQSAETIGRALDIPSQGLTALSRQGFRFTEEQKTLIKSLEATGRTAEAQGILIDALKSSYGGAAQAARDTFGGAVQALRNQINSLLTGSDGSLDEATQKVNDLTKALGSQEVKDAFATLTGSVITLVGWLAKAGTEFVTFGKFVGEWAGRAAVGADDPLGRVQDQIQEVQKEITSLNNMLDPSKRRFALPLGADELAEVNRQLADAQRRMAQLQNARNQLLRDAQRTPAAPTARPQATGARPLPPAAAVVDPDAARAAQAAAEAARRYLENLQAQLRATENLSVAETVLRDIQEGRLRLAGGVTQEQLLDVARQIDASRALQDQLQFEEQVLRQVESARRALADEGRAVFEATRTPIEQLNIELARLQRLLDAGAISWDTFARASDAAQDAFEAAADAAKRALSDMDQFTKTAAENIQRELGEGLYQLMQGNFRNIGDSFKQMLDRMVSEALAANIARKLFGGLVEGGEGAGLAGGFLSRIGGFLFGGGRAFGGEVKSGRVYEVAELGAPELLEMGGRQYLIPSQAGMVKPMDEAPAGRAMTLNVTVNAPPGTDRRTAQQWGVEVGRQIQIAMARGT